MAYRTGNPVSPAQDDPLFDSAIKAIEHARKESVRHGVVAVWSPPAAGDELIALVFEGRVFKPEY